MHAFVGRRTNVLMGSLALFAICASQAPAANEVAPLETQEWFVSGSVSAEIVFDKKQLNQLGLAAESAPDAPKHPEGGAFYTTVDSNGLFSVVATNGQLAALPGGDLAVAGPRMSLSTKDGVIASFEEWYVVHDPADSTRYPFIAYGDRTMRRPLFDLANTSIDFDIDRQILLISGSMRLTQEMATNLQRSEITGVSLGAFAIEIQMLLSQTVVVDLDAEIQEATMHAGAWQSAEGAFPTPGPDVIVGDLPSTGQHGRVGAAGSGTVGLAIGTTSCNKGDTPFNWFALPNGDHPMIPMNLYRLKTVSGSSRFEQVGSAWMKHGFTALQQNICGFGCTATGGTTLGVGCSDPYTEGLNAGQCGLGPRARLNPYTGVTPGGSGVGGSPCGGSNFPSRDHTGHTHSAIAHLVQVLDTDLMPSLNSGARYFSEGQYLTPHEFNDANAFANQNMHNNASYREVSVTEPSAGNFSFGNVAPTVREQPAVNVWSTATQVIIEPAATVDGRAFLSYEVTNLGGGQWHYEYAVYNMNLDRSIESFSVPVPSGVVLNNIEMHFPLNHNDAGVVAAETYSNTTWTVNTSGGAITWSTESFATNAQANAIRFGRLYNFRFNANSGPVATNATAGLFKTGGTTTVATQGPQAVGPQDCNNNGTEDSQDIALGNSPDCNVDGIPDECELVAPWGNCTSFCLDNCNNNALPDICEIDQNSTAPGGPFFCTAGCVADCNNNGVPDSCESDCNQNGVQDSCDIANLTSSDCNGDGTPDECEIDQNSGAPGGPFFCTTACDPDCNNNGSPDNCDLSGNDCNINGIPDDCDGAVCVCGNNVVETGEQCDDGNVTNGDGCDEFCQFESNDLCDSAIPIAEGATAYDTTGAGTDGPAHAVCEFDGQTYHDIWYTYIPDCDGNLTVSLCGSGYDTDLVVYDGCACPTAATAPLGCSDDNCPGGAPASYRSELPNGVFPVIPVTAGSCYLIRVGGWNNGDQGPGTVAVTNDGSPCFPDCNNNSVDDAKDITNGTSPDCNNNAIPDECETTGGSTKSYDVPVTPPLAIPDGTGVFVSDTFTVPDTGTIEDVNLELLVTHTYNGDLIVRLSHGGTTVVVIDQPAPGDDGLANVVLDDEGTGGAIESVTSGGPALTSPPSYTPNNPLSAFDGMDKQGLWTIEISDNAGQDVGTLDFWSLEIANAGTGTIPCCAIPADCADGNPCTDDVCTAGQCTNPPNTATCNDADACTINDVCAGGTCSGTLTDCTDPNTCTDCNNNNISDQCEGLPDCNADGIPDSCQFADCNNNGTNDVCEIAAGTSIDCDGGPVGVAAGGAVIFNNLCMFCHGADGTGGIGPNILDHSRVQIWTELTAPTLHPGGAHPEYSQQDFADIEAFLAQGGSRGRPDRIPDECQTLVDCDLDGTTDACELEAGTQVDADYNGTPDDCVCMLPCDDGDPCTTDSCDPVLGCVTAPIVCNDGNACTTDSCDAVLGCVTAPIVCDDTDPCTTDSCDSVLGCVTAPVVCDDTDPCTTDSCDPVLGCVTAPIVCDDGNACTTDSCDPVLGCVTAPVVCDDGDPCTADACQAGVGCVAPPVDCDDGLFCNGVETCDAVLGCISGAAPCVDAFACTSDNCNEAANTCVFVPIDSLCDNGLPCDGVETCDGAIGCVTGTPLDCDDMDACTTDSCDNNMGGCINDLVVCTPTNECMDAACDSVTGCFETPNTNPCDDGDACTENDACSGGVCNSGTPVDCEDGNPCTDHTCDSLTGCATTFNTATCDDGDACTENDVCSLGSCAGTAIVCDDGNPCTDDFCDAFGMCSTSPNTASCDDGNACTENDACSGGSCSGTTVSCDDSNECTTDTCDPIMGCETTCLGVGTLCDSGAGECNAQCVCEPTFATCVSSAAECCDTDFDTVRDSNCIWCECNAGICESRGVTHADIGGPFGDCQPDGFCNLFDASHALACFAESNPCDDFNLDIGGSFGDCQPDGFCNVFDANHALQCFALQNPCSCGPAPEFAHTPRISGATSLVATADRRTVRPGETVSVRVFAANALNDLQSYQLSMLAGGGRRGRFELVDAYVENRIDSAFGQTAGAINANNLRRGQLANLLVDGGVQTKPMAYLATYVYRVSEGAAGAFVIDIVINDVSNSESVLVGAFTDKIALTSSTPAVITVTAGNSQSLR